MIFAATYTQGYRAGIGARARARARGGVRAIYRAGASATARATALPPAVLRLPSSASVMCMSPAMLPRATLCPATDPWMLNGIIPRGIVPVRVRAMGQVW